MENMDFKTKYAIYLKRTEDKINDFFCENSSPQKTVFDAMRYAICGGGKRIRPILTQATAEIFGVCPEDAATLGLAVECIHNYSLIHDDMPCMDDDDLRRGRPTCHIVFGEDMAMLAGDGLLNMASEILSNIDNFKSLNADRLLRIINCLLSASGVFGMIGGQVVDLESEERESISLDELNYLHENKTGALIRAAAMCGCIAGNADIDKMKAIDEYARRLGLAFQIKDDILDVVGDEKLLGKPIGSDAESGKNTYVSIMGLDVAKQMLKENTEAAKTALKPIGDSGWFLTELAQWLLERNN